MTSMYMRMYVGEFVSHISGYLFKHFCSMKTKLNVVVHEMFFQKIIYYNNDISMF